MITKLEQIITAVQGREKRRLVVANAQDAHTLEAVHAAVEKGIVEAILVGNPTEIEAVCSSLGMDTRGCRMVDGGDDVGSVKKALELIHAGEADILMKGMVTTDKYMRGILNKEYGLLPPKGVLSHVAAIELPHYHKLVLVSDVAVIPYPDLNQKVAQIRYLTHTARALGIEKPKVAVIAPSEQMLPGLASAVDAAILAKMGDRGQLGNITIDGPLALDVALSAEAAQVKKLVSPVAGDADCLLMPALDAANVFFKAANTLCQAPLAAMVVGAKAPCILTSRGDSPESKLYSIALAALTAK